MVIMCQFKEVGILIVFIMYKLCEVCEVVDWIIVIWFGKVVGEVSFIVMNIEFVLFMVGCVVELMVIKGLVVFGVVVFVVDDFLVIDVDGQIVVNFVSFEVMVGEILVIVGVQGNGQMELVEVIFGLQLKVIGDIVFDGILFCDKSVCGVLNVGVGYIFEDC